MNSIDTVILVHGIWVHGVSMFMVKRRLEKEHGFDVRLFNYPSVRGTLDDNAHRLSEFIATEKLGAAHVVGHSLGGVIALRMYAIDSNAVPGRVVALGSPLTGSRAASFVNSLDWGKPILGQSLPAGVVHEPANDWASDVCRQREVGVIAGTVPIGIGRLVTSFDDDNDGTVAVAETRIAGARDHICLPVSHTSMLMSDEVVTQTAAFLRDGVFRHNAARA